MMLPLSAWLILLPYGVFVSALGTTVGLGGGAFVVPLLVLGFNVPLKVAVAAVTFSLFPSALLSTIFNIQRKHIDFFAGIALEIPTVLGAIIGAMLTKILPVKPLEIMFGILLIYMSLRMLKKPESSKEGVLIKLNKLPPVIHRNREGHQYSMGVPALGAFGVFAGILAGLFGIGGGIIKTPIMLRIFKMPARKATATAIFMITFTSATASYSHWKLGTMDWSIALPLGASFFCGSFVANSFGEKIKSHMLEKILSYTLIAAAFAIMFHAFSL